MQKVLTNKVRNKRASLCEMASYVKGLNQKLQGDQVVICCGMKQMRIVRHQVLRSHSWD